MPKSSGCCKIYIYIKNHDLCTISIILILSFLLSIIISHIYNEESNVHSKIAATRGGGVGQPSSETKARPGGGGKPIMVDSHSECSIPSQIKKVNLIYCERGQSGIGWHGWHVMV